MTVRSSRVRAVWGVVVASALLVSVGCGSDASPDVSVTDTSTTTTPSVESSAQRGVVFDSEPFTSTAEVAASGASAVKILYGSTSGIDGRETQVSGTVFTPPGTPPEGGWPIVSIGHGTTGISDDCAPSASPTLFGTIGLVAPFLDSGYVVAVSDFEGLGTPDPHPYLQPDTAAFNVIDAVRAARNVVPDTSTRWATLGLSQGGQASWAAAEEADTYGDGLEFVGAANLSPAADISPIISSDSEVNLSLPQQLLLPYVLEGLSPHPSGPRTNRLRARRIRAELRPAHLVPDLSGDGEVGSGRKGDARRHAAGYRRGCGPNSRVAQRCCSSPSTRERSDVRSRRYQ